MGSANTLEQRRAALELEIANHNKTLVGLNARTATLAEKLGDIITEELEYKKKKQHVDRINELLSIATEALKEAGLIGEEYNIDFTFEGPRGEIEFNERWMSSDCYGSNRWYDQGHQGGYNDN